MPASRPTHQYLHRQTRGTAYITIPHPPLTLHVTYTCSGHGSLSPGSRSLHGDLTHPAAQDSSSSSLKSASFPKDNEKCTQLLLLPPSVHQEAKSEGGKQRFPSPRLFPECPHDGGAQAPLTHNSRPAILGAPLPRLLLPGAVRVRWGECLRCLPHAVSRSLQVVVKSSDFGASMARVGQLPAITKGGARFGAWPSHLDSRS